MRDLEMRRGARIRAAMTRKVTHPTTGWSSYETPFDLGPTGYFIDGRQVSKFDFIHAARAQGHTWAANRLEQAS